MTLQEALQLCKQHHWTKQFEFDTDSSHCLAFDHPDGHRRVLAVNSPLEVTYVDLW